MKGGVEWRQMVRGTMPALPPERLVNARLLEDRSGYGKAH